MAKNKTVFVCSGCGYESPKWMGKCPACNEWNSFYEEKVMSNSSSNSGKKKEISKGYKCTTNNRMEIMAALAGLNALKEPCKVILYSDSKYLVDSVNKGWIASWQKNGWKNSKKEKNSKDHSSIWFLLWHFAQFSLRCGLPFFLR